MSDSDELRQLAISDSYEPRCYGSSFLIERQSHKCIIMNIREVENNTTADARRARRERYLRRGKQHYHQKPMMLGEKETLRGKHHSTVELKKLGEKDTIYLRRKGADILVLSMSGGVLLSTPISKSKHQLRCYIERGINLFFGRHRHVKCQFSS